MRTPCYIDLFASGELLADMNIDFSEKLEARSYAERVPDIAGCRSSSIP